MRERNTDVRGPLGLAAASAKRGDLEGAMVHLKEVLRVEPDHEIANGMLGGIYAELKMPERATACYEHVLATNPRNILARFQLGLLQLAGGQREEAAANLRQVAQLMPTDHESYPQLRDLLESLRS